MYHKTNYYERRYRCRSCRRVIKRRYKNGSRSPHALTCKVCGGEMVKIWPDEKARRVE